MPFDDSRNLASTINSALCGKRHCIAPLSTIVLQCHSMDGFGIFATLVLAGNHARAMDSDSREAPQHLVHFCPRLGLFLFLAMHAGDFSASRTSLGPPCSFTCVDDVFGPFQTVQGNAKDDRLDGDWIVLGIHQTGTDINGSPSLLFLFLVLP
jgi:hypothetical protein